MKSGFYFYDFTVLSKKIIFEYNGTCFHPNYEKNNNADKLKESFSKRNFLKKDPEKLVLYEKQKHKTAIDNGFKICILWEEDGYYKNFKKILNFIENNKLIENENKEDSEIRKVEAYLGYRS